METNFPGIHWLGHAWVDPRVRVKADGTNTFLYAEAFPQFNLEGGLTPALIDRVAGRTNLLVFDWEFTPLRFDTWFRIGQLALYYAKHEQLIGGTPSQRWIEATLLKLAGGGNTSTEILKTGPRELSFSRRGPLVFNSTELFWLANWLESPNFPSSHFVVPLREPEGGK
jgi:hypothetical protein